MSPKPQNTLRLCSLQVGRVAPLCIDGRRILSGIGKRPVHGPVAVGRLGLDGDEQADLSVHGGLDKAVYAYPAEHYPFWQTQRRTHGVSLFDEDLPPGFVGENLSVEGLLEHEIWVGDLLQFPDCVLRVTQAREPCFKFNAVMGYAQAAKDLVLGQRSGWYLAVHTPGTLMAGQTATLQPGARSLSVAQSVLSKRFKHLR